MNSIIQDTWQKLWYTMSRRRVFASAPRGGVCAEIGVWKGDFSARILKVLEPRELHLIDPWAFAPDFPRRWYGGAIAGSQGDMDAIMEGVRQRFRAFPEVQLHRGKSLDVAGRFADHSLDWLYIDGDHSYEAVLADIRAFYPKLQPTGTLVLDDYYWRDEAGRRSVKAAIEEFLRTTQVHTARLVADQFIIHLAPPQ
jgi:hypothetical protein